MAPLIGGGSFGMIIAATIFGVAGFRMTAAFDLAVGGIFALLFIGFAIRDRA